MEIVFNVIGSHAGLNALARLFAEMNLKFVLEQPKSEPYSLPNAPAFLRRYNAKPIFGKETPQPNPSTQRQGNLQDRTI